MYSATISPREHIRSDGQLHPAPTPRTSAPPPAPLPQKKMPASRRAKIGNISSEQVLIAVIAYLLLQNDTPDWMLIIALVYVLF